MRKRFLMTSISIAILAGCSVIHGPAAESRAALPPRSTNVGFNQIDGFVTLAIDGRGNFVSLKSTASAPALGTTQEARDAAITVATMRARTNIADFLSSGIQSRQALSNITKATDGGNTYARQVVEKISDDSAALLRGSYISRQSIDDGIAHAEITVTRISVDAAENLSAAMQSGLFPTH